MSDYSASSSALPSPHESNAYSSQVRFGETRFYNARSPPLDHRSPSPPGNGYDNASEQRERYLSTATLVGDPTNQAIDDDKRTKDDDDDDDHKKHDTPLRKPKISTYQREILEENQRATMPYAERKVYRGCRNANPSTQTSQDNIRAYVVTFARGLMMFGVPAHSIEKQVEAIADSLVLRAKMDYYTLPQVMVVSFKEDDVSQTNVIKQAGHTDFACVHRVHMVNKAVNEKLINPRDASQTLREVFKMKPTYDKWQLCVFSLLASALICPLAFGGSIVDAAIAGHLALAVRWFALYMAPSHLRMRPAQEHFIAFAVAFIVRGISSIRGNIICYSAISSSTIISLLPGFMLLVSALELGSGAINSGSMKMVKTLLYTVVLGFALKMGSDTYLDLDPGARHEVQALSALSTAVTQSGTWTSQNGTGIAPIANGPFTLVQTNTTALAEIHLGCYRPTHFPWYLQTFPFWTQFIIVPSFSLLLCLLNLQMLRTKSTLMMVVISSAAYATNSAGNHFFFGTRAYIVSAIGAQTVSLLGNLFSIWSHKPALSLMIPGMLLLVPSGLSAAGGIAADDDNFTQFTNAMLHVVIGIQVGLAFNQFFFHILASKRKGSSTLTL